ncbi:FAD-dependent oxidoreductase [Roseobacter sp. HKCCA0434]|uniref:NAD(P)/FAD-dependent oxidoreductase n=1 Tax=Roseobacter sp. HKCCA0434 TaxID=3079297 RepID=UPI002905A928|nr:FAD-dependent oxidoreductase [Roseobacter sp. HKCCA0434]
MSTLTPTLTVVGGGINGLATARAATLRGWQVTLVEAGPLPNPHAASWDHHRLIRSHYAGQPHYAARMGEAWAAWDRLFTDIAARPYVPRGVMALSQAEGDWTDRARMAFEETGLPHRTLDQAEIARELPMLEPDGLRYALLTEDGGALLSDRIVEALLHWLAARGVTLIANSPVTAVDAATATVHTAQGPITADRLVVAAGVGLPALDPWFAEHTHARRATVVYADVPDKWQDAWSTAPAWVDLGGEDDLWGIPPCAGQPLKLGYGLHTRPGDPATERAATEADTETILMAYRDRFREIETYAPDRTVANFYLMAPDQSFVLRPDGPTLWLSADSGHGFKFGALTGEDVADALEGDAGKVADRMAGRG